MVLNAASNWQAARAQGKAEYERGDYEAALASFRSAVSSNYIPAQDKQVLLSNVVACRLKVGGAAQARAAVTDAQACIALNPSWSKAHVRLASAYIALGDGSHSNDACNSLQTAIRLDPSNSVAKQMLVQELRRDHRAAVNGASSDDLDRDPPENPNHVPPPDSTRPDDVPIQTNDYNNTQAPNENLDYDQVRLGDRVKFYWSRAHHWYLSLSDDARAGLQILLAILLLYVVFGGRFGFESRQRQGHYEAGNVYERYRQQATHSSPPPREAGPRQQRRETTTSQASDGYSPQYSRNDGYSNYNTGTSYNRGGSNYASSDDSGLLYIALMGAGVYMAHLMGISPWQALMVMRMAGGGRPRGFGGGFGGGRMRYGRRRW